ncbi:MAG: DMT family transporter [Methylophilaceae bacterium]
MQKPQNHHTRYALIGAALVFIAAVTVSSKAIMVKLAYAYPVDASTLIALRMAFSVPFFIGLAVWARASASTPKLTRKDAYLIAVMGVLGGYGPMWFDFAGLAYVTAGLERIILYIYPTIVVVMGAVLFKQKISKAAYYALGITYIGVIIAVGHDVFSLKSDASGTLLGVMLVTISAFAYAAYLVASGRLIPRVGAAAFTAYTMLVAAVTSLVHYASTSHQVTIFNLPKSVYIIGLLMAIFATVLPAILLNLGIQRIGSSKAALISSVGPVSTILLAYVYLGENITLLQIIGTGLVLVGVLIVSLSKH